MNDFYKEFDELLKNALNNDSDLNGLTVSDDLVASTMKAIDDAAPRKDEIRAAYDMSVAVNVGAEEESDINAGDKTAENVIEAGGKTEEVKKARKKSVSKGSIISIVGIVAGIAAVVVIAVFINNSPIKDAFSSSEAQYSTTTFDSKTSMPEKSAAETDTPKAEINLSSGIVFSEAEEGGSAGSDMTAPAEDGLYYFEDEADYVEEEERSALLSDVYQLYDKELYKPIYDAVRAASDGEPVVSKEDENATDDDLGYAAGTETTAETVDGKESGVTTDAGEEEFDINDPAQLAQALSESKKMLEETGGQPSENANEIIESYEINGETVPDFEPAPEKNPYWTDIVDASDQSFEDVAALIIIYDRDEEADLDVCVQVFKDKCVLYDFAYATTYIYAVKDGEALAEKLRGIVAQ
ncbi:MAG: hypothetical protein K6E95_05720 [Lachnospiraceae bacterium]|nr:hypothetical protein [Lachnospiraceae bacterium]